MFWRSLTDPEYYKDILVAPFSFSLKYLFFLLLIISFISSVATAVGIGAITPFIPTFIEKAKDAVVNLYPQELVVTLDQGKIKTNVDEPYYIEFPASIGKNIGAYQHLITIDTKAQVSDYPTYKSIALVTYDSVVIPDDKSGSGQTGAYRVFPLGDIPESSGKLLIDKQVYSSLVGKVTPYLDYLPGLAIGGIVFSLIVLPFILTAFDLGSKLFYLLFIGLILWLVAKIMKKTLRYSQIYRMSMHALTWPIMISIVLGFVHVAVPLLATLVLVIFMIVVFSKLNLS